MNADEGKPLAAQSVLLAVARPLLRRGLLDWLRGRYPDLALETVADPVALRERLPQLRPQLLLAEPELLARAGLSPEQLPRVLLVGPARHDVVDRPPASVSACAQLWEGADEAGLRRALDCALDCPLASAHHCASDACALRLGGRPAALGLSAREQEVFSRLGAGEAPREIAAALGLSVKTVEHYRAQIKDKLALRDSRELLEFAVLWRRGLATRPSQLRLD
jgi:DNA-binding CsgD family transcriptional regulator